MDPLRMQLETLGGDHEYDNSKTCKGFLSQVKNLQNQPKLLMMGKIPCLALYRTSLQLTSNKSCMVLKMTTYSARRCTQAGSFVHTRVLGRNSHSTMNGTKVHRGYVTWPEVYGDHWKPALEPLQLFGGRFQRMLGCVLSAKCSERRAWDVPVHGPGP